MIFVDTSVWIDALGHEGPESAHLSELMDADEVVLSVPVRIELLSGASGLSRRRLRMTLSALPVFYPHRGTWDRIEGWLDHAGDAGERFGFADLLIGAIAADHGAPLWSRDADFERMSRIGLIALHRPG